MPPETETRNQVERPFTDEQLDSAKYYTGLQVHILAGTPDALAGKDLNQDEFMNAVNNSIDKRKGSAIYQAATNASIAERREITQPPSDWINDVTDRLMTDNHNMYEQYAKKFCEVFGITLTDNKTEVQQSVENFHRNWLTENKTNLHTVVSHVLTECTDNNKLKTQKFLRIVNSPYLNAFGPESANGIKHLLWAEARRKFDRKELIDDAELPADNVRRYNTLTQGESNMLKFWRENGVVQKTPTSEPNPAPDNQPTPNPEPQHSPEQEVARIKREIFETAGTRTLDKELDFLDEVKEKMIKEWGNLSEEKMKATIPEMADQTKNVYDNGVVYIPKEQGKMVVVGDLHGDSKALMQIINKAGFIENMVGAKDMTMIFIGDYTDVGKKELETIDILLDLKSRYPDKIVLLRGNHELDPTDYKGKARKFPDTLVERYYPTKEDKQKAITEMKEGGQDSIFYKIVKEAIAEATDKKGNLNDINYKKLQEIAEAYILNLDDSADIKEKFEAEIKNIPPGKRNTIRKAFLSNVLLEVTTELPLIRKFYREIFTEMPLQIVCGNGVTLSHAGPPRFGIDNLRSLIEDRKTNRDTDTKEDTSTMRKDMIWEEAIGEEDYERVRAKQKELLTQLETIQNAIQNSVQRMDLPPVIRQLKIKPENLKRELETMQRRLDAIKNTPYCFNPKSGANFEKSYEDIEALAQAVYYDRIGFTQQALEQWLDSIKGKILLRGHQIYTGNGPLSEKMFYTLQSTGKNGKEGEDNESGFDNIETPVYAVYKKDEDIEEVKPDEHIFEVWE